MSSLLPSPTLLTFVDLLVSILLMPHNFIELGEQHLKCRERHDIYGGKVDDDDATEYLLVRSHALLKALDVALAGSTMTIPGIGRESTKAAPYKWKGDQEVFL